MDKQIINKYLNERNPEMHKGGVLKREMIAKKELIAKHIAEELIYSLEDIIKTYRGISDKNYGVNLKDKKVYKWVKNRAIEIIK